MNREFFFKLGYKITYERVKKQLSQLELSLQSGLTTRTLSRIESGTIDPKISTLKRIADALCIAIADLLKFEL